MHLLLQTINQLVGFINNSIVSAAAPQHHVYQTAEEGERIADVQVEAEAAAVQSTSGAGIGAERAILGSAAAAPPREAEQPSGLLKLLRGAPQQRPLFLAAPGVWCQAAGS